MPCPYFEPQIMVDIAGRRGARLPLIHEYDGLCCAGASAMPAPDAMRFGCCNHGYSRGVCERFPASEQRSCLRYHLIRRTSSSLEVLCVEEQDYAPARWQRLQYRIADEQCEPEIGDRCMRAQVLAFCRAYLDRFPD